MSVNKRAEEDARYVRTGKDGALFLITDEGMVLLSSTNEFRITVSFQNADWQPTGSSLIFGVPTGHSITLTLTDATIRDDLVSNKIWQNFEESGLRADEREFDFQTLLEARNGKDQRILIRHCIPDGDVDLINIVPGEIVQHAWTFRCNADPQLLSLLGVDYEDTYA